MGGEREKGIGGNKERRKEEVIKGRKEREELSDEIILQLKSLYSFNKDVLRVRHYACH